MPESRRISRRISLGVSRHVILAGSLLLLGGLAHAGPLDLLFGGGQPKTNPPAAAAPAGAPVVVKRLGDGELSCRQLYDEVQQLEAQLARPQANPQAQGQASNEAGKQVMSGLVQSLLGAAPMLGGGGGGGSGGAVAGMVAQQVAVNQMQQQGEQQMQQVQQAQQTQMDLASVAQRREHLVAIFEGKRCKVAELQKN